MKTQLHPTARIQIGQRVYCGLYGGKYGIVYAIHGQQAPESIRKIAGIMSTGGRASLDIVFPDHRSTQLPEAIIRGVQWEIYDEIATGEDIEDLQRECDAELARKADEAKATSERHAAERQQHAASNPGLLKYADRPGWSGGRLAAENIRRELKKAFPGFKFKVTSDHNSVKVAWTDGPSLPQIKAITGKYQGGHFNGMEDIYESNDDATFAAVFGNAKYVRLERDPTLDGLNKANLLAGYGHVPANWRCGGCDVAEMKWIEERWKNCDFLQVARDAKLLEQFNSCVDEFKDTIRMLAVNNDKTITQVYKWWREYAESVSGEGGQSALLSEFSAWYKDKLAATTTASRWPGPTGQPRC
jgi:hypothetical protein